MEKSILNSSPALPDISELFPLESGRILCHINVLKENGAIWFRVLYNNEALPFYHITKFPYRLDKDGISRISAMLFSLITDSNLIVLEGGYLLREKDRRLLTVLLSEYSVRNKIAFLQLPEK